MKKPDESKGRWDYYKLVSKLEPNDVAAPLDKNPCPLLKK